MKTKAKTNNFKVIDSLEKRIKEVDLDIARLRNNIKQNKKVHMINNELKRKIDERKTLDQLLANAVDIAKRQNKKRRLTKWK